MELSKLVKQLEVARKTIMDVDVVSFFSLVQIFFNLVNF